MFAGLRCALWLKARHMRTSFTRALHFAGTDPVADSSAGDRVYQIYLLAFALAAAVLLWFAAADAVEAAFALMDAVAALLAVRAATLAVALALAFGCFCALRAFPLALSSADIAFLATGPLPLQAVVLASFAPTVAGWGLLGAAAGYPLGVGLAAAGCAVDPLAVALNAGLLAGAAAGAPWVVGAVRLARPRSAARIAVLAAGVALLFALVAAAGLFAPDAALARALAWSCAPLLADVALAEAALVIAFGARMDATAYVKESALFADMRALRPSSPYEFDLLREERRRRKVAARRPRLGLPQGVRGGGAVAMRAALSLARQPEGWPALLAWGCLALPFGAVTLMGAAGAATGPAVGGASAVVAAEAEAGLAAGSVGGGAAFADPFLGILPLVVWVALSSIWMARQAREVGRTFRDDVRVPLVRDRLPFGMLPLLAYDILPALAVVALPAAVISAAAAVLAGATLADVLSAAALAALLACAFALCCGLDEARHAYTGRIVGYETGAAAVSTALAVLSLFGSPALLLAGAALSVIVLAGKLAHC